MLWPWKFLERQLHKLSVIEIIIIMYRGRLCMKCDGTRAETRFRLSAKRPSLFKSVQSTTGSWGVPISGNNAGYTKFRGSVKGSGYSIWQFPLHFPSRVSPCPITFQLESTMFSMEHIHTLPCNSYYLNFIDRYLHNKLVQFFIQVYLQCFVHGLVLFQTVYYHVYTTNVIFLLTRSI